MNEFFTLFQNLIKSPFGQNLEQTLYAAAAQRAMASAEATVDGIITDEIKSGVQGRTEQQIIDDIDGRLWHNARHIIGFVVDEIRTNPTFDNPLRALITARLTAMAEESAPVTTGLDLNPNTMNQDGSTPLETTGGLPQ